MPVATCDAAGRQVRRRPAPGAVVLQTAAEVVGLLAVGGELIELPDGQRVQEAPVLGAVSAEKHAAVVALNHAVGIFRVNPERVMVGMNAAVGGVDRLAAVVGFEHIE